MVGGEVFQMWPATLSRPDERFDSSQVGQSVLYCELSGGRSKYKESGSVGLSAQ